MDEKIAEYNQKHHVNSAFQQSVQLKRAEQRMSRKHVVRRRR